MIPFRVIRSGLLLTGLLAALTPFAPAASPGFTASLTAEQKTAAGLDGLSPTELTALDRLVADDVARGRRTPALTDPYSQRYSESETQAAGLDRLTPEQLAKLDSLIAATVPSPPVPRIQPRERPRLRGDDYVLSEQGRRLQVHGGFSLTMGWAEGGRNFRETGAWVSYFDPVTGIGLAFSYSRYKGDMFGGYYGSPYMDSPYLYTAPGAPLVGFEPATVDRPEAGGERGSGRSPAVFKPSGRDFRR